MSMTTIKELNSKWWYRLVKVLFVILFVSTLPLVVSFTYFVTEPQYDKYNSYIKCSNGRILNYDEHGLDSDYIDYSSRQNLKYECLKTQSGLSEDEKAIVEFGKKSGKTKAEVLTAVTEYREKKLVSEGVDRTVNNFDFIIKNKERNVTMFIFGSLFGFVLATLIFESIRRVFYYVILGSFKPSQK